MGIIGRSQRMIGPRVSGMRNAVSSVGFSFGRSSWSAPLVGDPDGSKARAASERSRHAEPMEPIDRKWNYLEQTGRSTLTPRQTRRQAKKMRRQGWDFGGLVQA